MLILKYLNFNQVLSVVNVDTCLILQFSCALFCSSFSLYHMIQVNLHVLGYSKLLSIDCSFPTEAIRSDSIWVECSLLSESSKVFYCVTIKLCLTSKQKQNIQLKNNAGNSLDITREHFSVIKVTLL